ncbi:hypothetical protein VTK73DRAFT_8236 [Phialemonium thermophilum]|uniref:Uncharacterized protein n=1 Tax=Phialemonium thermophilum TaxID=223376 RepID=A0ABR3XPU5_9PEZI
MHYIRLLSPPRLRWDSKASFLGLTFTITTDLGDTFLSPLKPISLQVLVSLSRLGDGDTFIAPQMAPIWQAGMRVLKLELPLPSRALDTLLIRPADPRLCAASAQDIMQSNQGLIVPVYVDLSAYGRDAPGVCFRRLDLRTGKNLGSNQLEVQEEIGESIARHIWDAGLVTVAMLADLNLRETNKQDDESLKWLKNIFSPPASRKLGILELGCGVGILGLGIATILQISAGPELSGASILLTDLPEAEDQAVTNIRRQLATYKTPGMPCVVNFQYENLDWEDGRLGRFGPRVRSGIWDLVVLSDCTYNVDMLPLLVGTLSELHAASVQRTGNTGAPCETKVLLATKPRHRSESALFDFMVESGWAIENKIILPLPVLASETESVEIFLFSRY